MNPFLSTNELTKSSQSLRGRLWRLFIEPSPQLLAAERFQAKLLTSLILAIAALALVAIAASALVDGTSLWATQNALITLVLFVLPLVFVYGISRTQHYRMAAWGFIFFNCLVIFSIALPDDASNDTNLLTYLVVSLLFSSIFLAFRGTLLLGMVISVGLLIFELFVPEAHFSWSWDSPLNFVLLCVVLILVIAYHRDQLEALRQAKIAESEKRYRRLLQTTFNGVVIHQEGVVTEATIGFTEMLGYSLHEVTGMPLQRLITNNTSAYTKDGIRLDVEVIHNPQIDDYGKTVTVTAVRDITDLVRRQRLLETMNELSQAMAVRLDARFILDRFAERLAQALDVTSVHIYQWDIQQTCSVSLTRYYAPAASVEERQSATFSSSLAVPEDSTDFRLFHLASEAINQQPLDELTANFGIQTVYQAPFVIADHECYFIELWESRRWREYGADEIEMLRQMINHVTVALNNAYLLTTLQEREAQHRAMLAALPDLMFRQNHDGVYLEVHGDQKDMLLSPSEIIGRSMYEVLPEQWLQQLEPAFQHVLATGELQVVEYSASTADYYEARLVRCGDNEVLALVRNITERKMAEAQRLASEERFQQLSENVREVFWMSTHDPRELIYVSPKAAEILGITAEQLIANPVLLTEHVYHEDQANFNQTLQIIRQGEAAETEFRFIRPPQREIAWLWSRGSPIKDDAGQVYRIVGVLEDITSRKQAENQRLQLAVEQEKVRVLEQFIQDASHDLKTPLAVITTNLFLIRNAKSPTDIPRRLQVIELHVGLLERIIDDLLTMARLDNRRTLEIRPVDLNGVLRIIQDGLQSLATEKEHELTLILDPLVPSVMGDEAALHRALMNVIENALLYTPPKGQVQVKTYLDQPYVVVEVSDTGIGISEADLPRIFNRFFRANPARTQSGTGLGLPIVKRAIEAHGGKIELTSELNQGTTFKIYLKRMSEL